MGKVFHRRHTVRNMSTKDNPGTLPINLCLTEQPASQLFDFSAIGEVQEETAVTARQWKERIGLATSSSLLETLFTLFQMADHPAKQDITAATKKRGGVL